MTISETFSKAFNSWRSGVDSWGDTWKRFSKQPAPELPEAPMAKVKPYTESEPSPEDVYSKVDFLVAKVEELEKKHKAEIEAFKAKVAEAEAKPAHAVAKLDRLERSLGLSAAKVVAMTPAAGEQKNLLDTFNEIKDPAQKAAFYKQHSAVLSKFISKP